MLRAALIESIDRVGQAACGGAWVFFRPRVVAGLQAYGDEELRRIARVIADEADRLRGLLYS